jgi:hypothetical protein
MSSNGRGIVPRTSLIPASSSPELYRYRYFSRFHRGESTKRENESNPVKVSRTIFIYSHFCHISAQAPNHKLITMEWCAFCPKLIQTYSNLFKVDFFALRTSFEPLAFEPIQIFNH